MYLSTKCGGSGRGGGYHTTTYSAWVATTWDFTGALVSYQVLSLAPTVDPAFSASDSNGNEVYNVSGSAFLALAPGFVPAPRVTDVSVASGPASGGTTLTITGTGFTGATGVSFGTTAAAGFAVNGDTSITAVSPAANAGTVDVTVTTAGGTSATSASDEFTFVAAPLVSGISPTSGSLYGGTTVTITGAGFTDAIAVYFGENATGFTVDSDSSITAVSPPGEAIEIVDVTVASLGGTSARGSADRFTYVSVVPTVTSVSPNSGPPDGGTEVTITGTSLGNAYAVSFGGYDAADFIVNDDTSITAVSPAAAAGTVDVTVTTLDGTTATTAADLFTFLSLPSTVTGVSPTSGPLTGGTVVTIQGTNLGEATAVSFGGLAASSFVVNGDTLITATSPPASAGTVDVTVTTPGGTSAVGGADRFTYTRHRH